MWILFIIAVVATGHSNGGNGIAIDTAVFKTESACRIAAHNMTYNQDTKDKLQVNIQAFCYKDQ